jgi:F-type H+-transporting ATPase subunit gamma
MARNTKIIKDKIKAVRNIKKITKAMEMVAATKMRKAVAQAHAARVYTLRAHELLVNILSKPGLQHPLMKRGSGKKTLVICVASNRGLSGSFLSSLQKTTREVYQTYKDQGVDFITVGRRAELFTKRMGGTLIGSFTSLPDVVMSDDVWPISNMALREFQAGSYARVVVVYTRFISSLSHKPMVREMLPLRDETLKDVLEELSPVPETSSLSGADYLYEPSREEVLTFLLPRLAENIVHHALLESLASEHSARMVAMKNAGENAGAFIGDLTLGYNRARQQAITQEIAEIAAGAESLT